MFLGALIPLWALLVATGIVTILVRHKWGGFAVIFYHFLLFIAIGLGSVLLLALKDDNSLTLPRASRLILLGEAGLGVPSVALSILALWLLQREMSLCRQGMAVILFGLPLSFVAFGLLLYLGLATAQF